MKPASLALAAALATAALPALAADDPGGRFHVGLSWLSNMGDLRDKIEANNPLVDVQQMSQIGLGLSGY